MSENIVEIRNLVKRFPVGKGQFTALDGITLNIGQGEFTGLIGPSGSGKTTLLNIIGTLDAPSEGEVKVLGRSVGQLNTHEAAMLRRHDLGFIFQSYNLLAVHTVYENVEFPLLLIKMSKSERHELVMQALEWVGLTDKITSKPPQLSGGQCQRVAIARAMVKKPKLVLADEPTANLDATNSHHILETMLKINEITKTTFIFATHDEKVIGYLRRKIILNDGKISNDILVMPQMTEVI